MWQSLMFALPLLMACIASSSISAQEARGLLIAWTLSRTDTNAVGVEFVSVEVYAATTNVRDLGGRVQRIGNAQVREIIDYPNLDSMDIVDEEDLQFLRDAGNRYLELINRYPNATGPLRATVERLRTLNQLASNGEVRVGGRWIPRDAYHAAIAARERARAAAAKAAMEEERRKAVEKARAEELARQAEIIRRAEEKKRLEEEERRKAEERAAQHRAEERTKRQRANLTGAAKNSAEAALKASFTPSRLQQRLPGLPALDQVVSVAALNPSESMEIAQSGFVVAKVFTEQGVDDFALLVCEDESRHVITSFRFDLVLKGESIERISTPMKKVEKVLGIFDPAAYGWLPTGIASALTVLEASQIAIQPGSTASSDRGALPSAAMAEPLSIPEATIIKHLSNRFYVLTLTAPAQQPDGTITRSFALDVRATAKP